MDIEKFTDRAKGFLQAAQTIAIRDYHQRVTPEHLLKALLDDEQGAASGLITAAGGNAPQVKQAVDAEVGRQPRVSGGGAGQPQFTPDIVRVLDAAQQAAQGAGDSFVGGLMGYLATAKGSIDANIRRAMVYGSVTASFCCEGFGLNATTKATRKAIEQRVKELEKLTKF